MAVKVMRAPAIARNGTPPTPKVSDPATQAKPRRRRSSVYDADGNEVFITLMCLKCHKMRPLSQFGLRRMADGAIRNQPWCRSCRSGTGAEKPRKAKAAKAAPPIEVLMPPTPSPSLPAAESPRSPSASVAAQVAAALAAGANR